MSEKTDRQESVKVARSDAEWRKQLSDIQFRVTRKHAIVPAFTGKYHDHKEAGVYMCVCCGNELFDVVWQHDGAEQQAEHRFRSVWPGIAGTIDAEYARRQQSGAKGRAADSAALLREQPCMLCGGDRLAARMRSVRLGGVTLPEAQGSGSGVIIDAAGVILTNNRINNGSLLRRVSNRVSSAVQDKTT